MYGTVGSFGFVTDTDPGGENILNGGHKSFKERAKSAVSGRRHAFG
jgi:hypothetical protein